MTQAETLAKYFALTYQIIQWQLDGLSQEGCLIQPPFRGNCFNWVLGHLIYERDLVLTCLGETPIWSEAETNRYKTESEPIVRAEEALPLDQLVSDLARSQNLILAALRRANPEFLAAPFEKEKTRGEQIGSLHWHETYHVGQLELLRQLAGKNDKVI